MSGSSIFTSFWNSLPSIQSPILFTSTAEQRAENKANALEAKIQTGIRFIQAQGGPIKLTQEEFSALEQACARYGTNIGALILSAPHDTSSVATEGANLINAFAADVQAYIKFLQNTAQKLQLTKNSDLSNIIVVLNGLVTLLGQTAANFTNVATTAQTSITGAYTTTNTTNANANKTTKNISASELSRNMLDCLTAMVAGNVMPAKVAANAENLVQKANFIILSAADQQRVTLDAIEVSNAPPTPIKPITPVPLKINALPTITTTAPTTPPVSTTSCGPISSPITAQSPILFASTLEKGAKAEEQVIKQRVAQAMQQIQSQGGIIKFTQTELANVQATGKRYAADIESLINSGVKDVGPAITEGVALLNGLSSDLTDFIGLLQDAEIFPGATAKLAPIIAALQVGVKVIQELSSGFTLAGSFVNDVGTLNQGVSSGNSTTVSKSAAGLLQDLTNSLNAAVAGNVLDAKTAGTIITNMNSGFNIASQAANTANTILKQTAVKVAPAATNQPKQTNVNNNCVLM